MQNTKDEDIYELIEKLLRDYNSTEDKKKKSKIQALIATRMLPIIKRIARTIARRSYDPIDDLTQAGSIGLLKAIDSYSSNINDNFKIYAGYLIIGEMKHYLRDKMNAIKVPAYIQELSCRINSFTSTLTVEEINNLTNDDVAEVLNVSTKAVNVAMMSDRRKSIVSLDEIYHVNNDGLSYEEVLTKDDYKEIRDLEDTKIVLKDTIEKLPDDCREIIELFYLDDLNQKEIAQKLDLTEMQVSRKIKKSFSILCQVMNEGE